MFVSSGCACVIVSSVYDGNCVFPIPVQGLLVVVQGGGVEEVRDHVHRSPGGLRDVPSVLSLGVSALHHFLFGRLLQPLVEGAEALGGAGGAVSPQGIVLLCHRVPALVLVHDDGVLVGVLLQDAHVRAHQLQQVQLLRQGEVGGASLTHHVGHEH